MICISKEQLTKNKILGNQIDSQYVGTIYISILKNGVEFHFFYLPRNMLYQAY